MSDYHIGIGKKAGYRETGLPDGGNSIGSDGRIVGRKHLRRASKYSWGNMYGVNRRGINRGYSVLVHDSADHYHGQPQPTVRTAFPTVLVPQDGAIQLR